MSILIAVCMVAAVLLPERYQDHGVTRRLAVVVPLSLLALQTSRLPA